MSSNSNPLVDEKLAVSLFLDSLLRDTEEVTEIDEPVKIATEARVVEKPIVTPPVVEVEPTVEISTEIDTKTEAEIQKNIISSTNVPEWANEPFQILLFEVAGLKLAVPLVELSGVIEWNDSVTEMPGSENFYMGILQHLDHRVAVIDTAKMVLPVNKQAELIDDNARQRVKHIVLIDDFSWGLACDKIGEVITLQPEEVRWRQSKTSRRWLAGTVIEHMCALLNSKAFAEMLVKGQSADDLAQ